VSAAEEVRGTGTYVVRAPVLARTAHRASERVDSAPRLGPLVVYAEAILAASLAPLVRGVVFRSFLVPAVAANTAEERTHHGPSVRPGSPGVKRVVPAHRPERDCRAFGSAGSRALMSGAELVLGSGTSVRPNSESRWLRLFAAARCSPAAAPGVRGSGLLTIPALTVAEVPKAAAPFTGSHWRYR
jgi:hypothetical protein